MKRKSPPPCHTTKTHYYDTCTSITYLVHFFFKKQNKNVFVFHEKKVIRKIETEREREKKKKRETKTSENADLRLGMAHHHDANERSKELQGALVLSSKRLADLFLPKAIVLEAERPHLSRPVTSRHEKAANTVGKGRGEAGGTTVATLQASFSQANKQK